MGVMDELPFIFKPGHDAGEYSREMRRNMRRGKIVGRIYSLFLFECLVLKILEFLLVFHYRRTELSRFRRGVGVSDSIKREHFRVNYENIIQYII